MRRMDADNQLSEYLYKLAINCVIYVLGNTVQSRLHRLLHNNTLQCYIHDIKLLYGIEPNEVTELWPVALLLRCTFTKI